MRKRRKKTIHRCQKIDNTNIMFGAITGKLNKQTDSLKKMYI